MPLKESQEFVSIKDYLEGELHSEIKHEYLGGIVHAMSGGTVAHSKAAGNCMVTLGGGLKGKSCRPFNSDMALKIILPTQIRFYYPDLQIVCESKDDEAQYQDKPVVIIEVLSESTRRVDLGEKRDAYLAIPSLQVLIIIDPSQVFVRLDRRVENNGFLQETFNELDQVIELPEVEASLPLADIYDGIKVD